MKLHFLKPPYEDRTISIFVIALITLITALLIIFTWDINFWPTDAEIYYLPAAKKLPNLQYISQIHNVFDTEKIKWLHGKEMFIVHTAIFQQLFNDFTTLRPMILVCILSLSLSAFFIFLIARFYWGSRIGLAAFFLFTTSFWPYVYVLFVKHQPLGLCYFLLALFLLNFNGKRKIYHLFSGFFLCLSLYSSTVSSLYLPYYGVGWSYLIYTQHFKEKKGKQFIQSLVGSILFLLAGFIVPFLCFNYPNIIYNINSYFEYAKISSHYNHFFYNQPILRQWVEHPDLPVRGGWLWIFKYFLLIMPVLFPLYIICVFILILQNLPLKSHRLKTQLAALGIVTLSLSSPILAEIRGVAQYGANYFTSIVGIILLISYTLFRWVKGGWYNASSLFLKRMIWTVFILIFAGHFIINSFVFFSDVYPTRMMTAYLTKKIKMMGLKKINTYVNHPSVFNVVGCLNPQVLSNIEITNIENVYQAKNGYIVVPPITGDSIYLNVTQNTYNDYDKDIFLNEILRQGKIEKYAVASFDSLASSRIWPHEEEVLSYRALILKHPIPSESRLGKVWMLDTKKLWEDFQQNQPSMEKAMFISHGIRNIGPQSRCYMYNGEKKQITKPTPMKSFMMRIYKVGDPQDGLRAFIYKLASDEPTWIPFNSNYTSEILSARDISNDLKGQIVKFYFSSPLLLMPGPYRIVIYRTGKDDDKNCYRIFIDDEKSTVAYIKATDILKR